MLGLTAKYPIFSWMLHHVREVPDERVRPICWPVAMAKTQENIGRKILPSPRGGGGNSQMKKSGMLFRKFESNPKGGHARAKWAWDRVIFQPWKILLYKQAWLLAAVQEREPALVARAQVRKQQKSHTFTTKIVCPEHFKCGGPQTSERLMYDIYC